MMANRSADDRETTTAIAYSDLVLWREISAYGHRIGISLTLTNPGKRAKGEVVHAYLCLPEPTKILSPRLVGKQRIYVTAGETERVQFVLDPLASSHPFSYWNIEHHRWEVATGEYHISIGASATEIRLTRPFFWESPEPSHEQQNVMS